MGWLLTLMLSVPQMADPVQVEMWFSRESYCTFAAEKFTEQPMHSLAKDQPRLPVKVTGHSCRELGPQEINRVPPHMREASSTPEVGAGF